MEDVLNRHERIALQFSGGKDSLALLYRMRPYWDKLTVYWLNTGDAFPETEALVTELQRIVPRFCVIEGRQPAVIAEFGLPSDLVPAANTPMGLAVTGGQGLLLQDRYSCCLRSLMLPMHERMVADGITLIIRGQKASDRMKASFSSGYVEAGIEYLFPLEDWDDAQVFDYLKAQGVAVPRFYELMQASPDCMTCSAYWEDGRGAYLREHHPGAYREYQDRLGAIAAATAEPIAHFNAEIV